MKPRILVAQPRKVAPVSTAKLRKLAAHLLELAAKEFPRLAISELSIALLDDEGIAPVNEQYVKHSGATDVITFALAPPPGSTVGAGEIIINLQRALEEARRRRGKPERELAWYLAHGIDHLTGATDRTAAQRATMHRREKRWLNAAAKAGLIDGILR